MKMEVEGNVEMVVQLEIKLEMDDHLEIKQGVEEKTSFGKRISYIKN